MVEMFWVGVCFVLTIPIIMFFIKNVYIQLGMSASLSAFLIVGADVWSVEHGALDFVISFSSVLVVVMVGIMGNVSPGALSYFAKTVTSLVLLALGTVSFVIVYT